MNSNKYLKQFQKYKFIQKNSNPFNSKLDELNKLELQYVLQQYTVFPKNIIATLISATYNLSYNGLDELSSELIQNINEELGIYSDETILVIPKPHYTILRKGFSEGLGIEINHITPSSSTSFFIQKLANLVNKSNIYEVLGTVFALESSAIPELEIVLELVNQLFKITEKKPPKYLINFFNYHIDDIEIGHRDRFFNLCIKYLKTEEQKNDFENGFNIVLQEMEKWWFGMNNEIATM